MKHIILIRHAKSSWKYPDLIDFERPLNNRGKHDAPLMGKVILKNLGKPDYFLSSPARRALETAKLICKELNFIIEDIILDIRLYESDVKIIYNVISEINDRYANVYLCGHNPGLNELVSYLTNTDIKNIPTCGVAKLELSIKTWKDIDKGMGKLVYYDFPKNYYK